MFFCCVASIQAGEVNCRSIGLQLSYVPPGCNLVTDLQVHQIRRRPEWSVARTCGGRIQLSYNQIGAVMHKTLALSFHTPHLDVAQLLSIMSIKSGVDLGGAWPTRVGRNLAIFVVHSLIFRNTLYVFVYSPFIL